MGDILEGIKEILYVLLVENWVLGLSLAVIASYLLFALAEVLIKPVWGMAVVQLLVLAALIGIAVSLFDTNPIFAIAMIALTAAIYWVGCGDTVLELLGIRKKENPKKKNGKKRK